MDRLDGQLLALSNLIEEAIRGLKKDGKSVDAHEKILGQVNQIRRALSMKRRSLHRDMARDLLIRLDSYLAGIGPKVRFFFTKLGVL